MKRQLNLYGFRIIQRGDSKGYFFQSNFQRSDIVKAHNIVRVATPKKRKIVEVADITRKLRRTSNRFINGGVDLDGDYLNDHTLSLYGVSDNESEDEGEQNRMDVSRYSSSHSSHSDHMVHLDAPIQNTMVSAPASAPVYTLPSAPAILAAQPPNGFRLSALSSRLGFNVNLMDKFYGGDNQRRPVEPVPTLSCSRLEDMVLPTFDDIDNLCSDLYTIGPPTDSQRSAMFDLGPCGGRSAENAYGRKDFNVDEMLEFLGHL